MLEFGQVLRFDNLPPDLREQAEIYARAADNYAQGKRLSGFGYAETGGGFYRENTTSTTQALGGDPARDWFWRTRIGGGLSWIGSDEVTLDGNLDYRFVRYDELGAGLSYALAPNWSVRPEVLYIRDDGNTAFSDYSSTELWVMVRRSF